MTPKELDELQRAALTTSNIPGAVAISPKTLLYLIAACRERDALRSLLGGALRALEDIQELYEHGCEVCGYGGERGGPMSKAFDAKEDIRQALAQHRGETGGEP
jgi:hypothetical protein